MTFQEIATRWCEGRSTKLMRFVWDGFDRLVQFHLSRVTVRGSDRAIEDSINFLIALSIQECLSGFAPFVITRECPEQTAKKTGPGKSPTPDFCFVMNAHPRSMWSMEGKVLRTPGRVAEYCSEVTDNFMTGRYATFSNEGAMLGYLLKGDRLNAFQAISRRLNSPLEIHPAFPDRDHRYSEHVRTAKPDPRTPSEFLCHHLIFSIYLPTGTPVPKQKRTRASSKRLRSDEQLKDPAQAVRGPLIVAACNHEQM
jgi:hypothetical protein